jgi:plasmid stabilization system protein ParE
MVSENDPPSANYDIVCGPEFLAEASARFGDIRRWDEIQQNFDHHLSRFPHAAPPVPGTRGVCAMVLPADDLIVYFHVDDDGRQIVLLEIHQAS